VHDVNRKVWRKPTASLSQRAVANEKKEAGLCCLIGLCPAYSSFILALSSCAELKTMGFTKVAIIVFQSRFTESGSNLDPDPENDENFGSKNATYIFSL
jgi:hypothetical protein